MERIQASHKAVNLEAIEQEAKDCLAQLQGDGSLRSIDYKNRHQTDWKPLDHLDQLKSVVLAYTMNDSKYYGDAKAYDAIEKMLRYWYSSAPTSTNWYMQQIAVPQRIGVILILMRSGVQALPSQLENQLIERMEKTGGRPDQPGSLGTAANKLDIATHWIYRGCLLNHETILSFGVQQAFDPLILTTDEGLQHDFSYQQHGPQLYIGGYGDVLVGGIARLALYMEGTPYVLPTEKLDLLSRFVRQSYIPVTRGQYFLYNVMGRGLSRKGSLKNAAAPGLMQQMIMLDPANRQNYEDAIYRLKGEKSPGYGLQSEHTHFWRSDYTLHQRPAYTFDVRMASIHTSRNENGNGENLKGYFLTDGATNLSMQGDEYNGIFPVWDWARLPGVTNPIVDDIPLPRAWQTPGTSKFAGGVSNGMFGVTTYTLNDNNFGLNISAKKAWFFFDEEVVCLGAGISSTSPYPVNTTVNQCTLKGDVTAFIDGQETAVNGFLQSQNNLSWVIHNGVSYLFPEEGNISICNQIQKGTWKSINTPLSGDTVQKEVFKIWFDHGVSPQNEKYAYIIVPDKGSVAELKKYNPDNVTILSNTDSVQAVVHRKLNICGIVFYNAGTFSDGKYSITADKPCVILLDYNSEPQTKIYLADPSRVESNIDIEVKALSSGYLQRIKCKLPVAPDPYAGATVQYTIGESL